MEGQLAYAGTWPIGSMGLCPWAASFAYGSNRPCTPFPAPAAPALGEVARFCARIGPPVGHAPVVLVVPMEWEGFRAFGGYQRVMDPTWQAVHALAAAHVPFSTVQEDQLGRLSPPRAIVFPASQPVNPETQARLDGLGQQGASAYTGAADTWVQYVARYAIPMDSDGTVWCLRRGTREGRLYMLYAPDGPATVTLRDSEATVELHVPRYALVEVQRAGVVRQWVGKTGTDRPD